MRATDFWGGRHAGDGRNAAPARPTLKTLAQATGLAVATVSRALADAPDLRPDTKALVRRVAAEMGYVPNRAGLRLRTGRTQVIALVIGTEQSVMNNTAQLIVSLAAGLRGTPYHLNMTPVLRGEDPLRPIRHIVENGLADAVIFNQTRPRDPRVAWLMERGFPFATHGRTIWSDRHPWADYDNEAFGALAVRRLLARGRKRIALLAPPLEQTYARAFVRGATAAAEAAAAADPGISLRLLRGITSDSPGAEVQAALERAFARGADGLVSASSAGGMAAVAALEARGLLLGRDADIVAKEAIPFLSLFRRDLIVLREDVERAGTVLARAAIRAITEPDAPPLQDLEVPADDELQDQGEPRT
nr:LacI family transcriptional regulator [Rubellimicrobium thermophilum]